MNANGLRRKFKEKIDDYVNVNYKRAGREFKDILEPPTKKARTRAAPKNTKPVDDMRPTEIEGHDQSYWFRKKTCTFKKLVKVVLLNPYQCIYYSSY